VRVESKTDKSAGEAGKAHSAFTEVVTDADGNVIKLPGKSVHDLITELGKHPTLGLYYRAQATSGLWRWTNTETQEKEHKEIEARYEMGRYTIWEAAQYLLENGFRDVPTELVGKISKGITGGMLLAYAHGHDGTWTEYTRGAKVRPWYIECYGSDLNKWFSQTEPRSSIRFPELTLSNDAVVSGTKQRPVQRQQWRKDEILRVIRQLGYDPKKLRPFKPGGGKWVLSEVKGVLQKSDPSMWKGTVFKHAWDDLRSEGEIAETIHP
jgi:hypothetical protein